MSDKLTIRIDDEAVLRAFRDLAEHARAALEDTARDCAQVVVDEANSRAIKPVVEALVDKSSATRVDVKIGVPKEQFYVAIFETGAQPHEITPHKKFNLFFEGAQGEIFTRSVKHPGVPARPFLRPALEEKTEAVKDLAAKRILLYKASK